MVTQWLGLEYDPQQFQQILIKISYFKTRPFVNYFVTNITRKYNIFHVPIHIIFRSIFSNLHHVLVKQ